jgi:hypothetical protein
LRLRLLLRTTAYKYRPVILRTNCPGIPVLSKIENELNAQFSITSHYTQGLLHCPSPCRVCPSSGPSVAHPYSALHQCSFTSKISRFLFSARPLNSSTYLTMLKAFRYMITNACPVSCCQLDFSQSFSCSSLSCSSPLLPIPLHQLHL